MQKEEDPTSIRMRGGGSEIGHASQNGGFELNSASVLSLRKDPRYSLSPQTLGRMERLAKARFIVAEKTPNFDPAKLDKNDEDTIRSIALSVFASSEIEGEGVSADYVEAFVTAHTEPGENVDSVLRQRLQAHRDIIDAYFWALVQWV